LSFPTEYGVTDTEDSSEKPITVRPERIKDLKLRKKVREGIISKAKINNSRSRKGAADVAKTQSSKNFQLNNFMSKTMIISKDKILPIKLSD
jgi:hypothetical protein